MLGASFGFLDYHVLSADIEVTFWLSDSVSTTQAVGCQQRASVAGETGTGDFNPNKPLWAHLSLALSCYNGLSCVSCDGRAQTDHKHRPF